MGDLHYPDALSSGCASPFHIAEKLNRPPRHAGS